jgi:hypothetical protein
MDQNHRRTKAGIGATSLVQTSDGGYAIAGETYSFGAGEADVYVVKLDANGNLQWTKTIGGPDPEEGSSLIQTSDGGYAIAGYTISFGAGEADVYVVKLDANGNLQWTKTIGGPGGDCGPLPHSDLRWRLRHHRLTPNPSAQESGMSMSSSWTRMAMPAAPSARPPG